MQADMLPGARNLFDRMPMTVDDKMTNCFMQSILIEGDTAAASGAVAAGYDPKETQSQAGRETFTPLTYDQAGMQTAFMQDQVSLKLDGFPLDHEFPEDSGLEEEDELDIEEEPFYEDELTNQVVGVKPKRKRRRAKAYTATEDKFLSMQSTRGWVSISKRWKVLQEECNKFCATYESIKTRPLSGIGMEDMAFQVLEAFKVQHEGKSFHLSHCWRIIKDEKKFKAQYAVLMAREGEKVMEEVGKGEKP
ncbi:Lectin-domain containing receptor kinase A4.3 [Hordeum vulgare]|nr:Lectin-domain containing receptor kinase A4.3 [Hordeum vulgare]